MTRCPFIFKLIVVIISLALLFAGQPVGAASPSAADTTANQATPEKDDSKDTGDQLAFQFSEEEIQAIAEARDCLRTTAGVASGSAACMPG